MKKRLLLLLLLFVFPLIAFAQKPNEWKGLVLNESTPEKVIEVFGKPKTDKPNALPIFQGKWMTKNIRQKTWRLLHYENVVGFNDVKLGFDSNSKLVLIHLEPKKIEAQAFLSAYPDLEFRFADEVLTPADFKSPRRDDTTKSLGVYYVLIGLNDSTFVFTGVGNATGSVASTMFGGMGRKASRSVAGDVKVIQLVSRTLENKEGVDLLK